MTYSFGGDTGITPEMLKRRRAIAQGLMQSGRPRNVADGLGSAAKSIVGALLSKRADGQEAQMRDQFNESYSQVVPEQMRGVADLYANPMANDGQRRVLAAMMQNIPAYRRGTGFHMGGMALVGEDGPEVVELPRGAKVHPNPATPVYDDRNGPAAQNAPFIGKPEGYMQAPEPNEYLRGELGDQLFQQYQRMTPQQRMDFMNDPANGFVPPAPEDPRAGMQFDAGLRPESGFDDTKAYQTADLDAFKLMELQPKYEAPVEADVNTTEGGRLSLLRRMMFADAALEDPRLAKAMTKLDQRVASKFGALGRLYTSDEFQLGDLMSEQFANAVLRNDSGAQAPEPEVQRYARQYFPLPNESDTQLKAKSALRREVIRSMMQALGGDASPAMQQVVSEIEELKRLADVPDGSLMGDADISQEDKDFLKSLGLE